MNWLEMIIDSDIEYQAKKLAEELGAIYSSVEQMFSEYPHEMQLKTDGIVEYIFALQKNWFQYRAPKWINVVDSLQKYATQKLNFPSGDYSYIAEMIENEFIHSSLKILLEYGVPRSAVVKIQKIFILNRIDANKVSEDDIIEIINRNRQIFRQHLSEYEAEIVERVL